MLQVENKTKMKPVTSKTKQLIHKMIPFIHFYWKVVSHLSNCSFCFHHPADLYFDDKKMLKIRSLWTLSSIRTRTNDFNNRGLKQTINQIKSEYDTDYLTNPVNYGEIKSNIVNRKGVGNIEAVCDLVNKLNQTTDATVRENLQNELQIAMKSIPNRTHPDVVQYGEKPMEIDSVGSKPKFGFKPKTFPDLCSKLNILRTNQLGNFNGSRSYYLMNELAELVTLFAIISYAGGLIEYLSFKEEALIRYTVDKLNVNGFELISVPEILPPEVIEGCGMKTSGERNQVCAVY